MEPTPERAAEGAAIVDVLAAVLDRLVASNSSLGLSDTGQVTKFHALKAPGISVRDYLHRMYRFACCSNECYVLALVYIDRLIQRSNFLLTDLNVHRVVVTAILLAAKFFDDAYYDNAYYARIGGVLVSELNGLEVDFLFRVNFSLRVAPDEFFRYKDELIPPRQLPQQQQVLPTHIQVVDYRMAAQQQHQLRHHRQEQHPPGPSRYQDCGVGQHQQCYQQQQQTLPQNATVSTETTLPPHQQQQQQQPAAIQHEIRFPVDMLTNDGALVVSNDRKSHPNPGQRQEHRQESPGVRIQTATEEDRFQQQPQIPQEQELESHRFHEQLLWHGCSEFQPMAMLAVPST